LSSEKVQSNEEGSKATLTMRAIPLYRFLLNYSGKGMGKGKDKENELCKKFSNRAFSQLFL
jgi:hypothetical protein